MKYEVIFIQLNNGVLKIMNSLVYLWWQLHRLYGL